MAGEILRVSEQSSAFGRLRWAVFPLKPRPRATKGSKDVFAPNRMESFLRQSASSKNWLRQEDRVVVQRRVVLFGSQRPGAVRANRQFRWAIWWVMMVSRMQSATSAEKPSRGSTRTTAAQSVIGSSGRCCNVRQPPPQSAASRRQRHGKPPCRLTRPCFRARSFGSGSDG